MTEVIVEPDLRVGPESQDANKTIEWLVAEIIYQPDFSIPHFENHGINRDNLAEYIKKAYGFGFKMGQITFRDSDARTQCDSILDRTKEELNGLFAADDPNGDDETFLFTKHELALQDLCRYIYCCGFEEATRPLLDSSSLNDNSAAQYQQS